jgi:hypothetical protein
VVVAARWFLGRQESEGEHEIENLLSVARESASLKF